MDIIEVITWVIILGGMGFLIWYGFGLLVRKPGVVAGQDGDIPLAQCHLCKKELRIDQMVARERMAGIVHYFCGDCIEKLQEDYRNLPGAFSSSVNPGGFPESISKN